MTKVDYGSMPLQWLRWVDGRRWRLRRVIVLACIVAVVTGSCASVFTTGGNSDDGLRAQVDPIVDNIIDGMRTEDYAKYSRDFSESLKKALTEGAFLRDNRDMRSQLGECKSGEYMGFMNQAGSTMVLYKARFSKTEDDLLIRLSVSKEQDRYLVVGIWVQ